MNEKIKKSLKKVESYISNNKKMESRLTRQGFPVENEIEFFNRAKKQKALVYMIKNLSRFEHDIQKLTGDWLDTLVEKGFIEYLPPDKTDNLPAMFFVTDLGYNQNEVDIQKLLLRNSGIEIVRNTYYRESKLSEGSKVKITDSPKFKKRQEELFKSGSAIDCYLFAKNVEGADIKALYKQAEKDKDNEILRMFYKDFGKILDEALIKVEGYLSESTYFSDEVNKLIKIFHLERRKNSDKVLFEKSGIARHSDYTLIQRIIPDFELIKGLTTAYTWTGYSEKFLITVNYVEGDIFLIISDSEQDLKKEIKRYIDFHKENN